MRRSIFFGIAALTAGMASGVHAGLLTPDLETIHEQILVDYESVEHITLDEFDHIDQTELIVFDVRELSEYAVSHIDSAIQLDPDISASEFETNFGDALDGKTLVFYCSVGRRSSNLASELNNVIEENNASASYNLKGGIFNWRNEEKALVNSSTQTTKVHPYNLYWGQLIEDRDSRSYKP